MVQSPLIKPQYTPKEGGRGAVVKTQWYLIHHHNAMFKIFNVPVKKRMREMIWVFGCLWRVVRRKAFVFAPNPNNPRETVRRIRLKMEFFFVPGFVVRGRGLTASRGCLATGYRSGQNIFSCSFGPLVDSTSLDENIPNENGMLAMSICLQKFLLTHPSPST